jgi:hypothetical protein
VTSTPRHRAAHHLCPRCILTGVLFAILAYECGYLVGLVVWGMR